MRLIISTLLAALGVVGIVGLMLAPRQGPPIDYEALERRNAQAQALAPLDTAVAAAWRLFPLAVAIASLSLTTRWAWLALQRFERERHPDRNGLLPVERDTLDTLAPPALGAWHATRLSEATRPLPPHTITYRGDAALKPSTGVVGASPQASDLPDRVDLSALHWQPSLERILLGLGPGGTPLTVPAAALCHVALLGATGQGKSAALRLLIPQLLATGCRVLLLDPHYVPIDRASGEDWRVIARRLHQAPAVTSSQIDTALHYAIEELDRRISLRRDGEALEPPLWLAIDELPVIVNDIPDALPRLGRVLREGRKVGLFVLGASQSMLVKSLGGDATVRDAYRTAIYAGGDSRSATALLDVSTRDIPEARLGRGVVMLRSAATPTATLARVPWPSNASIIAMLEPEGEREAAREAADRKPLPQQQEAREGAAPPDSEEARLCARFLSGSSISELARELAGGATGGRAYQVAADRVAEALRRGLRRSA